MSFDGSAGSALPDQPQVAGIVYASVSDGAGGYFIGGEFTAVGAFPRSNLAHILPDNGVDPLWQPSADAAVNALSIAGSTVYAGGAFTTVQNGATPTQRNRAAAFDVATGNVSAWDPDLDNTVHAVFATGSGVYVGGAFTAAKAGTATRNRAAQFDSTTGALNAWNPDINGNVYAITPSVSGTPVYVGGSFSTVNGGVTRRNVASFDAVIGMAQSFDASTNSIVRCIAVHSSGSPVYLGGEFSAVNGTAATRRGAASFDAITSLATSWDPGSGGNVYALALSSSTLYLGGLFGIQGVGFTSAAAFDVATQGLTGWNPSLNGVVRTAAISGPNVYLGGGFTSANAFTRNPESVADCGRPYSGWGDAPPAMNTTGPFVFSLEGSIPPGMSIDPDTGRIHWTPTSLQLGPYDFAVRADQGGESAQAPVRLTVSCESRTFTIGCGCGSQLQSSATLFWTTLLLVGTRRRKPQRE